MSENYRLDLNVGEVRTLMEALAEMPFKVVYEVIGNINEAVNFVEGLDEVLLYSLDFTADDIKLIIKALGARPFNEVYNLIGKINDQLESFTIAHEESNVSELSQVV